MLLRQEISAFKFLYSFHIISSSHFKLSVEFDLSAVLIAYITTT
jgi:hypothetical protein